MPTGPPTIHRIATGDPRVREGNNQAVRRSVLIIVEECRALILENCRSLNGSSFDPRDGRQEITAPVHQQTLERLRRERYRGKHRCAGGVRQGGAGVIASRLGGPLRKYATFGVGRAGGGVAGGIVL